MDHSAEATQLNVVIVILVVAYFGVMVWTRRVKVWTRRVKNRPPGEGGGGIGVSGGAAGGIAGSADDTDDIDGMGVPAKKKGPDRHKGRFQLQGKDAETAAKVLKRMLQQDPRYSDQGGKK